MIEKLFVAHFYDYDTSPLIGVFSSPENAKDACEKYHKRFHPVGKTLNWVGEEAFAAKLANGRFEIDPIKLDESLYKSEG